MATALDRLVDYAISHDLVDAGERTYRLNCLYGAFCPDGGVPDIADYEGGSIQGLLDFLCDEAVRLGRIADTQGNRDRFDSLLMGLVAESPAHITRRFYDLYEQSPQMATDWFYRFSRDVNYIRAERVARDVRWEAQTRYGTLELSINLSKPEKDPRDIAAAGNLRIIPIQIHKERWGLQYSPYVYYDEHCIVLNQSHKPMSIDDAVFGKLFDFTELLPHYFIGSNADLPIVGGSILSHEHFQGGIHELPMAKAPIETSLSFVDYPQITAGIVKWPMSVIRLQSKDRKALSELAARILAAWREYTDESAFVFSHTDGEPHNTITPIARMRDGRYELDLVLRNNITTAEHPLGVFHPHADLHHIKKENIGLIEVQGLAVLPARLRQEWEMLKQVFLSGGSFAEHPQTAPHAVWMQEIIKKRSDLTADTFDAVMKEEIALVFEQVLEDAGVFKRNADGQAAFLRFVSKI